MSVGLEEAARRRGYLLDIPLAVDTEEAIIEIFKANLPGAHTEVADVAALFDGEIGGTVTEAERGVAEAVGQVDVLLGGPPCQGHSDLNNHTRRRDPKNALYLKMARAAEVLAPRVVVVENVVPVQWDEADVVTKTSKAFVRAGYKVAGRVLDLRRLGVPQLRRRFVLVASMVPVIGPASVLDGLASGMPGHPDRSIRWAIHDLVDVNRKSLYETASGTSEENARRMAYLFQHRLYDLPNSERPECHRDGDHSYLSMYGRLRWDEPAQTITTGFGSMGQGRYVHPARRRTITPHEAARLQTFPDWFEFGESTSRGLLAKVIGNAVPPLMMVALGTEIIRGLEAARLIHGADRR